MVDHFFVCPKSVFRSETIDELFDGDPGQDRTFYAILVLFADDWGRFEGDAPALARDIGVLAEYAKDRLSSLENRGLISRYNATGRIRQIGELVHWDDLDGKDKRRSNVSERSASKFPDRNGEMMAGRRGRKAAVRQVCDPRANEPPPPTEPFSPTVEPGVRKTSDKRASDVRTPSDDRATPERGSGGDRVRQMCDDRGSADQRPAEPNPAPSGKRVRTVSESGATGVRAPDERRASNVRDRGEERRGEGALQAPPSANENLQENQAAATPAYAGASIASPSPVSDAGGAEPDSEGYAEFYNPDPGYGSPVGNAPAFMPAELAAKRGPSEPYVEPYVLAPQEPPESAEAKVRRELAEHALEQARQDAADRKRAEMREYAQRIMEQEAREAAERMARDLTDSGAQ